MASSTRSRKAKGRRLQNWVKERVLHWYPQLTENDVWSRGMGQNGTDLQLSAKAMVYFPFAVECKNVEKAKGLYDMYDQAVDNATSELEPLLFIKTNRRSPIVVVDADLFFRILQGKIYGP